MFRGVQRAGLRIFRDQTASIHLISKSIPITQGLSSLRFHLLILQYLMPVYILFIFEEDKQGSMYNKVIMWPILLMSVMFLAACANKSDSKSVEASKQMEEKTVKVEEQFYSEEISDELFDKIYGKSFKEDCTVPREELRYLHVLHKDLSGQTHEGEMIVNKHIADEVLDVFCQLYEADYPIEKIHLVDEYNADDELSMEDNNSSAFNFRFISHTTRVSKHGLGLAIDINPLYNPYIKVVDGERILEPITAEAYVDRSKEFDYKIDENDLAYKLFTGIGLEWGGSWESAKDYQHFEMKTEDIEKLYPGYSQ